MSLIKWIIGLVAAYLILSAIDPSALNSILGMFPDITNIGHGLLTLVNLGIRAGINFMAQLVSQTA